MKLLSLTNGEKPQGLWDYNKRCLFHVMSSRRRGERVRDDKPISLFIMVCWITSGCLEVLEALEQENASMCHLALELGELNTLSMLMCLPQPTGGGRPPWARRVGCLSGSLWESIEFHKKWIFLECKVSKLLLFSSHRTGSFLNAFYSHKRDQNSEILMVPSILCHTLVSRPWPGSGDGFHVCLLCSSSFSRLTVSLPAVTPTSGCLILGGSSFQSLLLICGGSRKSDGQDCFYCISRINWLWGRTSETCVTSQSMGTWSFDHILAVWWLFLLYSYFLLCSRKPRPLEKWHPDKWSVSVVLVNTPTPYHT